MRRNSGVPWTIALIRELPAATEDLSGSGVVRYDESTMEMMAMQTFSFRIILADVDDILDDMTHERLLEMSNAVFEAGGDDSSPGASCGVVFVDFDREADSLRQAIESAIADIERAGYRVACVEPDHRQVFDTINEELASRTPA